MKRLIFPFVFIALSIIHSCTNFKEEVVPNSFGVNITELNFSSVGETLSLTVSSGSKWDIQSKPQWVSLGSISQSSSSPFEWVVNFSTSSNEGYDRNGAIQIKTKSETANFLVSQAGKKGKYVPVESVSLSATELSLSEGEYASLSYVITPSNASVKEVTWKSDSPEVATVNSSGRVDAVSEGTAMITCTTSDGGKTATCEVTVNAKVVVSLDQTSVSLKEEETHKLHATISPSSVTTSLIWTSRDETIATVSSDGTITALLEGTTTIMVEPEEGGNIATCNLTVTAEHINFKDDNFKKYIIDNFDLNKNGKISLSEGKRIQRIEINTDNIKSVQGIEMLQELRILKCSGTGYWSSTSGYVNYQVDGLLTTLDISNNLKLEELNCEANHICELDVSKNSSLKLLNCGNNEITSLDLSMNRSLSELKCFFNNLTSLDVSNNTALTYLNCNSNRLASLNVTNNKALTYLSCATNWELSSLDVSKNSALSTLCCEQNRIVTLDVSKNNALTYLECEINRITTLSLSRSLEYLGCGYNNLNNLDVTKCISLKEIFCRGNKLSYLDVSNNTVLSRLFCGDNQISTLLLPPSLTQLDCEKNKLTSLNISNISGLNRLYCHGNQLTSLDISNNSYMATLGCNPMDNDSLKYLYMSIGQSIPSTFDVPSYTQIIRK